MKVAILTDFYSYDLAYSLCGVVNDQIAMLRGNEDFVLVVDQAFPQGGTPWNELPLRRIPGVPRSNEPGPPPPTWDSDIEKLYQAFRQVLNDVDVVLTHDMIFQWGQVLHHIAARKYAAERPDLKWLHWVHSATPSFMQAQMKMVKGLFPNSKVVFPNQYDRPRVAKAYNVPESDVVFVPHPTDIYSFLLTTDLGRDLVRETGLLEADVIGIYPVRLDRGKQVEFGIEIMAEMRELAGSVRYVVCDFHSTGGDKVTYRDQLKQLCAKLGLNVGREVIFTSEWRKETEHSVPRGTIRDLMNLTDLLILPSVSETYSLVAQEAALCRAMLMLNADFTPMRSIYSEDVLYAKFSSNIDALTGESGNTTTKYSNRRAYMREQAARLWAVLQGSPVLRQFRWRRKQRKTDAVYREFLVPLLYAEGEK